MRCCSDRDVPGERAADPATLAALPARGASAGAAAADSNEELYAEDGEAAAYLRVDQQLAAKANAVAADDYGDAGDGDSEGGGESSSASGSSPAAAAVAGAIALCVVLAVVVNTSRGASRLADQRRADAASNLELSSDEGNWQLGPGDAGAGGHGYENVAAYDHGMSDATVEANVINAKVAALIESGLAAERRELERICV